MNKEERLLQEWVEQDIQKAVNCRVCPATRKECNIPNPQTADHLRLWYDYIDRCAKNNSSDIFSVSDKPRFVECCNDCDIYVHYKYLQKLSKPYKPNNQKTASKRISLLQDLQMAWDIIKSRIR